MNIYDDKRNEITTMNEEDIHLLNEYIWLWEHIANISDEEFQAEFLRLKQKDPNTLRGKSWIALTEGIRCGIKPQFGDAFEKLNDAILLLQQLHDKHGEGAALTILIISYKSIGQIEKAHITSQKAIEYLNGAMAYRYFIQIAHYQSGEINYLLKDYESALKDFEKGLSYGTEDDGNMGARLLNGIGNVYNAQNKFELAFTYLQKSLQLVEGKNNSLHESKIYADLGNYYFKQDDFENALKHQFKSIEIREKNKFRNPLLTNYIELAEIYLKQKNLKEAFEFASLAEKKSIEFNVTIKQLEATLVLSKIYEEMNEPEAALERYKIYHKLNEEILGQENTRKIKQLSMRHEMENVQNEKEIFRLRNVVLRDALNEIESSVRYAKRIQEAILPPLELIHKNLPEAFVLYKPKDIVAGDFYWMETVGDIVLIAAADCTGHGVPGALVSVVCSNALNRAVKEFKLTDTGKILDKTTDLVLETFAKSSDEVKDGMDISLLSIHKTTGKVQWSGAHNPLVYSENGKLKEITADKQPIGKSDQRKSFTTHSFNCEAGTIFYLFTDGYADQFGGPKGKKFKYKQLLETLANISNQAPTEQCEHLNSVFENWRENIEQVDDVCLIGVKIQPSYFLRVS